MSQPPEPMHISEVIRPIIADLIRDGYIADVASVKQEVTSRLEEALQPIIDEMDRALDGVWEASQGEDL